MPTVKGNAMQYLVIIKTVLTLLPIIIEAVKAIESAFPESGQGQQKLAAVRAIVQTAYDTATDTVVKFDAIWPAIQSAVSAVVELANAVGLFKKS